jgi:peptide/nickel transport system substrate-binding protein
MKRKGILLWILISALTISIISNGVLLNILFNFNKKRSSNTRDPYTFILAISANDFKTIDPIDVSPILDQSSIVLDQVVETLFTYDLRDLNLPRINLLAESYFWENVTTLHIKLREGIAFHDGTPFNATAAKWNLDRLQYLTNCTGTNHETIAQTRSLWIRPDGKIPIINNVEITGEYNITIILNASYGPFLNTLTLINAGMISPTSHSNDFHSFIEITDKLVGTGPFIYEHYIPDVEVRLARWNGYRKHVAFFKIIQYKIYDNGLTAHEDMHINQVDYSVVPFSSYCVDYSNLTIKRYTDDTGIPSLGFHYLGINNKKYNNTWRKVICNAINYSFVLKELRLGTSLRSFGPISPGFGTAYNTSLPSCSIPANSNLTVAREIMVSMGFGDLGWTDDQWINQSETNPFLSIDYNYNLGNTYREDLMIFLTDWLKLIGIALIDEGMEWTQFEDYLNNDRDNLGLFAIGFLPDYLEPYNILQKLYDPLSSLNSGQVNDTKLNEMMKLALETTNDDARDIIYKNIQGYMAEQGYYNAPLYQTKIFYVHSADLRNVPYNAMKKFQAYGIWRVL